MKFRTEIDINPFHQKINHQKSILFIGSCFSNNIGNKLIPLKFPVLINPFGVVYNPISVKVSLEILMAKDLFGEQDLQYHNDQWFSFYHHSSFSNHSKEACLQSINSEIENSSTHLKSAKFLFITFGTAWVYEKHETGNVVSNCHKLPTKEFNRRLLFVEQIVNEYTIFIEQIQKFNPDLNIIFTVSPIRHWKDGAIENQKSKSILNVAIHQLCDEFECCSYFPSYELIMDDLRDYRFYEKDLLHLSESAVEYIWEKFQGTFFSPETIQLNKQVHKIALAKQHRAFNQDGQLFQEFLKKQLEDIRKISAKQKNIDFSSEINYFTSLLRN